MLLILEARCSCHQNANHQTENQNDRLEYSTPWPTCQGGNITVKGEEAILYVADKCPRTHNEKPYSCYHVADMDVSVKGYALLTGGEYGNRLQATYEFIECPKDFADGPTKIRFGEHVSFWNFDVMPMDHRLQIVKITIQYGLNPQKYDLAFDRFAHWWSFRVGVECKKNIEIPINDKIYYANRWFRSVGKEPLWKDDDTYKNPVIIEVWNSRGESAKGTFDSLEHMKQYRGFDNEGEYFHLDNSI